MTDEFGNIKQNEMEPAYYAIIPATVRYNKNLCANAKLMYGEITALTKSEGYCWATNKYFANLYNVSKDSVSRWISGLTEEGFIRVELIQDKWNNTVRRIYLGEGMAKLPGGGGKKAAQNNISSIISNNKFEVREVVEALQASPTVLESKKDKSSEKKKSFNESCINLVNQFITLIQETNLPVNKIDKKWFVDTFVKHFKLDARIHFDLKDLFVKESLTFEDLWEFTMKVNNSKHVLFDATFRLGTILKNRGYLLQMWNGEITEDEFCNKLIESLDFDKTRE